MFIGEDLLMGTKLKKAEENVPFRSDELTDNACGRADAFPSNINRTGVSHVISNIVYRIING